MLQTRLYGAFSLIFDLMIALFCKRDILRHHHAWEGIVHICVAATSASLLKGEPSISMRSPIFFGCGAFIAKLWHSMHRVSATSDDRVRHLASMDCQGNCESRLSVHLYENCIRTGLDLRHDLGQTEFILCDLTNSVTQVCLPKYSHTGAASKPRSNPSNNGKARF